MTHPPSKSVQFSHFSQLVHFEGTADAKQWYSLDEKVYLKRELARDARRLRRILATRSAEAVSQDDVYKCIGIEHLLSLDKARRVMEYRRIHVKIVTGAQGSCNQDELRHISQKISQPSAERAQNLAAGYWSMLDCV